jgi:surface antigen
MEGANNPGAFYRGRGGLDRKEKCMGRRLRQCLSAALVVCVLLPGAAPAQINPFRGSRGQGLSPEDNQLLFQSVARLNAAEPSQVGRSEAWNNPQTNSSGTSIILRVFHSGGMACHLVRHHIVVAGRQPGHNYRLTWCRTSSGEWKIKG